MAAILPAIYGGELLYLQKWHGDQHHLLTLSLPVALPCNNLHGCVIWVHAVKAAHAKWRYLVGLAVKKSEGTILTPHMTARWPLQQIPSENFLGYFTKTVFQGNYTMFIIFVRNISTIVVNWFCEEMQYTLERYRDAGVPFYFNQEEVKVFKMSIEFYHFQIHQVENRIQSVISRWMI